MEELKPLVDLISRNKLKKIEVAGMPGRKNTHLDLLFDGIAQGKFTDDKTAAEFFYAGHERKMAYLQRLKRQLAERLVNTIFFIDASQPSFNEYQRAYYNSYKSTVAAKILLGRLAGAAAIPLAEQTLKKALEFEFTDLIVETSRMLMNNAGRQLGDVKKYKHYTDIYNKYSIISRNEGRAAQMNTDLLFYVAKSSANNIELVELAVQYCIELDRIPVEERSYAFHYHYFFISSMRYELDNDYPNMLKIAKQALEYFELRENESISNITYITGFLNRKLACNIRLGQFKEGETTVQRLLSIHTVGSTNWYHTHMYYMILCFHNGQYPKTLNILQTVTSHPSLKNMTARITEFWSLFNAFVHYFIHKGEIVLGENAKLPPFKISKFLNEVPTYSKDKRGANIAILILEVLFLLHQKKFGEIIDKVESLNMYVHRYLKKDDTFRSNCFIKMLLQLPQANFNRTAVVRKAQKFWDMLQSMPLSKASQGVEIEIVPYEVLWEHVLQSLETKTK